MAEDIDVTRLRLKNDFEFYSRNCLFIKTKSGKVEPFTLNKAQLYIHQQIEDQKDRTGKVRAIILKGRQQGCSTYVEGRFIHKTTFSIGKQSYILTHEDEATKNLFSMAKRYYDNLPSFVKPSIDASNDKSLRFNNLDSGYRVGTAGNKTVGRSMTNQLFHGSEVAFWPNAQEHAKGILQTISDDDETEIILESTANGVGGFFHEQWKKAERGEGEYISIFVPWFWQDEYRKEYPKDIQCSKEEDELMEHYGLDLSQIYWRRMKIIELSTGGHDGLKAFKQEYPMNAAEAFQVTGGDGLIPSGIVVRARKNKVPASGELIVGVDPSRGGDRFAIIRRARRKMYGKESYTGSQVDSLPKMVAICKKILDNVDKVAGKKPDMMFIDFGSGADLVDRLHELGYEDRVKCIKFGGSPLNPEKYTNKRNEMWGEMYEWLADENLDVEIPDDDEIQADFCASPYDRDSHDRKCLWRKEKIKKEYGFSPDFGDAGALTFAEPVGKATVYEPINFDSPFG